MSAAAKANTSARLPNQTRPTRLTLPSRQRPKPGWWLPAVMLLALVWFLGVAAAPQTVLLSGLVGLGGLLAYLGVGFCAAKATALRQAGWLLVAWAAAADQLHRAFLPPHTCGIVPWLLAFAAGGAGSWLAVERVRTVRRVATPAENLAFQMNFDENSEPERKSA